MSNKVWNYPDTQRAEGESLLDYLLRVRQIEDKTSFLNSSLTDLRDWRLLHDVETAARVILEAIKSKKKIFIHGDFDVDGVTATAILWSFLYRELTADVSPYIPSRFDEGYGLTTQSMNAMIEQGAELIITVDCGVKDIGLVSDYKAKGIDFIITDHHTLPVDENGNPTVSKDALAVVHPQYPGHEYPEIEISGAMVAWKVICGLAELANLSTDVNDYLDLVALGAVCDVMPLRGENRIAVKHGINSMNSNPRPGILSLLENAAVNPKQVQTYHLGYMIGPRINAAGRMESAMTALRALTTTSYEQAKVYAQQLANLNTDRQQQTQKLITEAEDMIAAMGEKLVYVISGEDWPEGIVGLVAGKLTEKYHRPVIVGSNKGGVIKASARSIGGFHIARALQKNSDLLQRHGGHELAAGLTINAELINQLADNLESLAAEQLDTEQLVHSINIDAELPADDITANTVEVLANLEPFGSANPEPVFTISSVTVVSVRRFGNNQNHVGIKLLEYPKLDVIAFNAGDELKELQAGTKINIAGHLGVNEWRGNIDLQFRIRDWQFVS